MASAILHLPDDGAVDLLGRVVASLLEDRDGEAAAQLGPIGGQTCVSDPVVPLPTLVGARAPSSTGRPTRSPSLTVVAGIYLRDHFICTYCGRRTIPLPVMRLISTKFPHQFPHHPNWKFSATHRLYWDISTTLDHVHAVSVGGSWDSRENLTTACARCQYQKGTRSVEDLGWARHRTVKDWDGLVVHLEPLWERLERPDGNYHRAWLRALRASAKRKVRLSDQRQ
jgi:5-methylcytosine-specific restriction endonuclease McrA